MLDAYPCASTWKVVEPSSFSVCPLTFASKLFTSSSDVLIITAGSGSLASITLAASNTLPNPTTATLAKIILAFLRSANCFPDKLFSIIGENIFINRIEYKHPSGRFALIRISTVNIAAPNAKIQRPCALVGEVTGSVNINTAPNITPPVNRCNNGYQI